MCSSDLAVSVAGGNTYGYDANGNQTTRVIGGSTFALSYDAENRLVSVSGPSLNAQFTYDGDGRRVMSTINGVTTTFVGNHYEVTGGVVTKYYYAEGSRVSIYTRKCSTHIHPHCASNLRQQCATFATGLNTKRVNC